MVLVSKMIRVTLSLPKEKFIISFSGSQKFDQFRNCRSKFQKLKKNYDHPTYLHQLLLLLFLCVEVRDMAL